MSDYVTAIRTIDGDKKIDYNALANLPTKYDDHLDDGGLHITTSERDAWNAKLDATDVLSNDTVALYGLGEGATPDSVLNWIGQYNTHWWKCIPKTTATFIEEKTDISENANAEPVTSALTIQYSKESININQDNGTISLKNPVNLTLASSSRSDVEAFAQTLVNNAPVYITSFIETTSDGSGESAATYYYIPSGANYGTSSVAHYTLNIIDHGSGKYAIGFDHEAAVKAQIVSSQKHFPRYSPKLKKISSDVNVSDNGVNPINHIQISKSINVDQTNGAITLVDAETFTIATEDKSEIANLVTEFASKAPMYITNLYGSPNSVYYIPYGATASATDVATIRRGGKDTYGYYIYLEASASVAAQLVEISQNSKVDTTVFFVNSIDRNAYPDHGMVDDITYNYLGVPFENIITIPKFEYGSYIGIGFKGEEYPNSISFSTPPKFILMLYSINLSTGAYTSLYLDNGTSGNYVIYPDALTESYVKKHGFGVDVGSYGYAKKELTDGQITISWYNTNAATKQCNISGHEYHYVAIY